MIEQVTTEFWRHVTPGATNDCWLWRGPTIFSYGLVRCGNRQWRAHRISFLLANGPFRPKASICHKCDTPLCVNPAHLFIGSRKDNALDMAFKGRAVNQQIMPRDWADMQSKRKRGWSPRQIAKHYGTSLSHVRKILRRDIPKLASRSYIPPAGESGAK